MTEDTITLGNTTITARDINIKEVSYYSEPRKYFVTIQYQVPSITENGIVSYTYEDKTYECTEEEYNKYKKELFGKLDD